MAIYTHLSHDQIAAFLQSYDLSTLETAQGIAEGIENTNYLLTLEDKTKAILTLFEKRAKAEDLPFYIEYMAHLAQKGINCPLPYLTREGKAIRELAGRPTVVIGFLQGKGVEQVAPFHLAELGREMARMHLAVQDFSLTRPNDFAPHQLGALYRKTASHLDQLQPGLSGSIAKEVEAMQQWPKLGLPQGVIHADLFPDNVFFEGERLTGIIDFYFACTDYLAYDLAICLNAWCFEDDGTFSETRASALRDAYNRQRPLSDAETQALPLMARGAALRFLLTRAHDWFFRVEGALVTPKDPMEYLHKWQYWCHR